MSPQITIGNEVAVKDGRQVGPRWPGALPSSQGSRFVLDVCGVAAFIGRGPLSLFGYTTPISNLRRAEVTSR